MSRAWVNVQVNGRKGRCWMRSLYFVWIGGIQKRLALDVSGGFLGCHLSMNIVPSQDPGNVDLRHQKSLQADRIVARSLEAVVSKPTCRHLLIPHLNTVGVFASRGTTTHVVQPCRSFTVGCQREANSANKLYFLAAPPVFPVSEAE